MSRQVPVRFGRVSPLTPNWRRSVQETYEFKTEIFEARDGTEDRWALRENPRYALEHDTHVIREEIQRYLGDLAEQQHRAFHVPLGWRRVFLTADATAGAVSLDVTEVPWWLVPGCRLVLSGNGQVEAAEVLSVSGTTVTLPAAIEGNFPSGSALMLAVSARAQDDVNFRGETGTLWRGKVVWEADPGADPFPSPAETPETYAGYEVFLRRPNWRDRPRISIQQMREMVDAGRGTVAVSDPAGESRIELRMLFSGFDAAAADSLVAFFLRMKGKRGAFWMPTWQQDLGAVSGSGTGLTVAGEDAYYAYNGSRVFNAVAARHPDGSYQINRVTGVSLGSGTTQFTMSESWDAPITAGTTVMWSPLWRFATDRLEVERVTGRVTEMQFSVVSLIQEAT